MLTSPISSQLQLQRHRKDPYMPKKIEMKSGHMVRVHNQRRSKQQATWHRLSLSSTNVWRKFEQLIRTGGHVNTSKPSSMCMSPQSHILPRGFRRKHNGTSNYGVVWHSQIQTRKPHQRVPYAWKICADALHSDVDTKCVLTASHNTRVSTTRVRSVVKNSLLNPKNSQRCL